MSSNMRSVPDLKMNLIKYKYLIVWCPKMKWMSNVNIILADIAVKLYRRTFKFCMVVHQQICGEVVDFIPAFLQFIMEN